ncbi:MAG: 8-amino-7-oxononanoate synthase [Candidatus Omnitrophota bacterium]
MNIETLLRCDLDGKKKEGTYRKLQLITSAQERVISIDGQELINFCSNNYLGLANDPRLKEASIEALKKFGTGTAASRLICGSFGFHKKLEEGIAKFKHSQAALVFNCGYMANLALSALTDKDSIIFSDKFNHASIVDGLILSRAKFVRYNHSDMNQLEELLKEYNSAKKKLIVTDTVFSMDGDLADLRKIVSLASEYKSYVYIDEAHATGVFGPTGAGLAEELALSKQIDIQMGTLSKALGSFGAFIAGSQTLIEYLINTSRSFIYTTSLPAAVVGASIKAIEIVQKETNLKEKLWKNIKFIKQGLLDLGLDCSNSNSAIIPIITHENALTMEFSKRLFKKGLFVQGIRPPTVPKGQARLRIAASAIHTQEDLDKLLEAIKLTARELGFIQ